MSNTNKKHRKLSLILCLLVVLMFGFGFALVPIYNKLCKALNINGKPSLEVDQADLSQGSVDMNRWVTVQFTATNNAGLAWDFYPKVSSVRVHLGEFARLAFYAKNKTDHRMTVQAIPSVTPGLAAKYIKKTECFCFTQQTLEAGASMTMPLVLHVDKDLPQNIHTLTLAYTLFDVSNRVKQ